MRSTIASRDSVAITGGTQAFTAMVSGAITVSNFSGAASSAAVQKTQYIWPGLTPDTSHWNWIRSSLTSPGTNWCLDVLGASTTSGTSLITYGCKNFGVTNQQWKFNAGSSPGYFTITPRNAPALRIDNNSSPSTGAGITVANATTSGTTNQMWQLQGISSGVFQIVSSSSGLCLTSTPQSLSQITQDTCDGSAGQQFKISQAFESFICSGSTSGWTFNWITATTGPYHVQVQGQSTDLAVTNGNSASSVTIPIGVAAANSTTSINFIDSNGSVVGTGTITRPAVGSNNTCSASDMT